MDYHNDNDHRTRTNTHFCICTEDTWGAIQYHLLPNTSLWGRPVKAEIEFLLNWSWNVFLFENRHNSLPTAYTEDVQCFIFFHGSHSNVPFFMPLTFLCRKHLSAFIYIWPILRFIIKETWVCELVCKGGNACVCVGGFRTCTVDKEHLISSVCISLFYSFIRLPERSEGCENKLKIRAWRTRMKRTLIQPV